MIRSRPGRPSHARAHPTPATAPIADAPTPVTTATIRHRYRGHAWLTLIGVLAGAATGAAIVNGQSPEWESTTTVLVPAAGAAGAAGPTIGDESELATSDPVLESAAHALAAQAGTAESAPTAASLRGRLRVNAPTGTTALTISYRDPNAAMASATTSAVAAAYIADRQRAESAAREARLVSINDQIREYNGRIASLSARLTQLRPVDRQRAALDSELTTLTNLVTTRSQQASDLAGATATGGQVLTQTTRRLPPSTSRRVAGGLGGAVASALLANTVWWRIRRRDRRVRRGRDVTATIGVPVLADLHRTEEPLLSEAAPRTSDTASRFDRIRNEILAALPSDAAVLLVTGASRGDATAAVAANLATALARVGNEVVLVCARPPAHAGDVVASDLMEIPAGRGLGEVIAGTVSLSDGIRQAPSHPCLRVVRVGGAAAGTGLLQSPRTRQVLTDLRCEADYLVIEAPSTAEGADAQSLACLADAAILAVERHRSTYREVIDAAQQLERVATPLLGAVLLPNLRPAPRPPAPASTPVPPPSAVVPASAASWAALESRGRSGDDTVVMTAVDHDGFGPADGRTP